MFKIYKCTILTYNSVDSKYIPTHIHGYKSLTLYKMVKCNKLTKYKLYLLLYSQSKSLNLHCMT